MIESLCDVWWTSDSYENFKIYVLCVVSEFMMVIEYDLSVKFCSILVWFFL